MCTVLLPPGGYPIAVNKYITTVLRKKENTIKQEKYKILKSKMRIKRGRYRENDSKIEYRNSSRIVYISHGND